MGKEKGFTLIELMVTVAVLVIVLSIAIPSFSNMLLNNRISTTAYEVQAAMQLARSEAVQRKRVVTLCRANAAFTKCEDGKDWTQGWLLVAGDDVLNIWQSKSGLDVNGPSTSISFLGNGMSQGDSEVGVQGQDCPNGVQHKVQVNSMGRIRLEKSTC